jgi:ABC-type uncharacterized transport system permease subunit
VPDLNSINLNILGRPNISLIDKENILTTTQINEWITILVFIACILFILMNLILKNQLGIYFRAFGQNQKLLQH